MANIVGGGWKKWKKERKKKSILKKSTDVAIAQWYHSF